VTRFRRTSLLVTAAALVAATPARPAMQAGSQGAPQTPVFRSGTSAVMVDVSVRDASRRAVTGLTAADFTVLDNGIVQQIDDVSFGRVPIDVTVGLDVSYSVTGPLLDRLRRAVGQLVRDLRREDRLRLIVFNMRVTRLVDFTNDAAAVERAMRTMSGSGGTSLFDALSVAMVSATPPDRRQLVVFFTDGNDGTSITPPGLLQTIAERTRATVSFVVLPTASTFNAGVARPGFPVAPARAEVLLINPAVQRLAADTGGSVLPAPVNADLGPVFLRALDAFRSTYVLHYSPRNVASDGFHAISVQVNRPGATVQARRGYFAGR
jgi:VWFA-related protein